MFKRILLVLSLCCIVVSVSGQQPPNNVTQYRGGFNTETLTVSTVSKALTSSVYAPSITGVPSSQTRADYAFITVEGDSLRWWPCSASPCSNGAPTSSTGHLQVVGSSFTVWGFANIQNLRMIRVTTDATIQVSYYRFMSNSAPQ